MKIQYSVSMWNFYHYSNVPGPEQFIPMLHELGYGIELWSKWKEALDLFSAEGRQLIKPLTQGKTITLHTSGCNRTFETHKKQIDAAADFGAPVIVLHPEDVTFEDSGKVNVPLVKDAVAYAADRKVKLALENGPLSILQDAIEKTEGLGICIDVGHVYFTDDPMSKYLDVVKHRLFHLHIQEMLPDEEKQLPCTGPDHYIPGTGVIPADDWKLLIRTLHEINYDGVAVFEIQPRNPFQTALWAKRFMGNLLQDK
jgi:sugar phosphate isomerase/epimerase